MSAGTCIRRRIGHEAAMEHSPRPGRRPARPFFSSGPTVKRPGWSHDALAPALVGRSIRAQAVLARIDRSLDLTRELLQVPNSHRLTFMPGSDTGAVEAALWSLLGPRRVQVTAFENFGRLWAEDLLSHLDVEAEALEAPYGELPDLDRLDPEADLVMVWNGTTSGVRFPDAAFLPEDRAGLVICDATSAAFCMDLPWDRLDVVTFSFQKALGGEAGIGALALSPRAIERLSTFTPSRPVPKLLRLHRNGAPDEAILDGSPVNTYSLVVIEDWIDAVSWGLREGGLQALKRRTEANFATLSEWVDRTDWIAFLAERPEIRSTTSVVLRFADPRAAAMDEAGQRALAQAFCAALEREGVAYDLASHRAAPPGVRIWCGCTVDREDVEALTGWLDWAWRSIRVEAA